MTPLEIKAANSFRPAKPGDVRCIDCERAIYDWIIGWKPGQNLGKQWRCTRIGLGYRRDEKINHADTCSKADLRKDTD